MKEFLVTQDCDYIAGHLRYGHLEGIIKAESLEEARAILFDGDRSMLNFIIDDFEIENYRVGDHPIKIKELR